MTLLTVIVVNIRNYYSKLVRKQGPAFLKKGENYDFKK